ADRVPMAALAIDLRTGVLRDGVIADEMERALRHQAVEHQGGQGAGEASAIPAAAGQEAVEAGGVPGHQRAQRAEEFGDVAATDGQEGGEEEDPKTEEGRACKGRGEGIEQLTCRAGQSVVEVAELASCLLGLVGLTPLQAAALGFGKWWALSPGYTGHGGLLVWGTG